MLYYMYDHKADEISLKGVKGEKVKCIYPMIHYCEYCHTDIVGVWAFDDKLIDFSNTIGETAGLITYQPQKLSVLREGFLAGNFFESESECRAFADYKVDGKEKPESYKEGTYKNLLASTDAANQVKRYREELVSFVGMRTCPICGKNFSDNPLHHFSTVEFAKYKRRTFKNPENGINGFNRTVKDTYTYGAKKTFVHEFGGGELLYLDGKLPRMMQYEQIRTFKLKDLPQL